MTACLLYMTNKKGISFVCTFIILIASVYKEGIMFGLNHVLQWSHFVLCWMGSIPMMFQISNENIHWWQQHKLRLFTCD